MEITPKLQDNISKIINDLFYSFEAKMLGVYFKGDRSYFKDVTDADIENNIESIYRHTLATLNGIRAEVDTEQIGLLADIVHNFLEAKRLNAINKIIADVRGAQTEIEVKKMIKGTFAELTNYIALLTTTETAKVRAYATVEGVTQVASSVNDSDPTCAIYGKWDEKTCKYCKAMYHSEDNPLIPRVHKLSELHQGYFKAKEFNKDIIFLPPLHPRCRHNLTYIPNGYGFNERGDIIFKEVGWDEHYFQKTGKGIKDGKSK